MSLNLKGMAAINKRQETPAGGKEQPYECRWSGCALRFTRHKDADRHYNNIHDRSFDAHCPVCNKKISDARKDKQKQHMEKKHGGIDSRQPWGKSLAQEQPTSSATFTSNLYSMTPAAYATLQPSESNCVLCGHSSAYAGGSFSRRVASAFTSESGQMIMLGNEHPKGIDQMPREFYEFYEFVELDI